MVCIKCIVLGIAREGEITTGGESNGDSPHARLGESPLEDPKFLGLVGS